MEYGLIGEKLQHSYSPLIHRCLGDYDYRLYPLSPEALPDLLRRRAFRGLNVTIPYKQAVLPYCDACSDVVQRIGSANTLVNRDGRLTAYNTDLAGFLTMVRQGGIAVAGKKAVILGSGGTSLTAREACRQLNARQVVVISRQGPVTYDQLYAAHFDAEILINATPVGMYPHTLVSPVDLDRLPHLSGVIDVIYNPGRTALLLDAQERGIPNVGGLWMLAAQAWHAAQLFLDQPLPEEKLHAALTAAARACRNLVLIGMPGSGKTTLAALAAQALGKPMVDLDREIEKIAGPIPEIFARQGEEGFRNMEAEVIRRFGRESGLVIAAGGGAILRRDNVRALRQNGIIAWIRRPLEALAREGRPLSAGGDEALRAMEQARTPLYAACADFVLENCGTPQDAARQLTEGFYEAARS